MNKATAPGIGGHFYNMKDKIIFYIGPDLWCEVLSIIDENQIAATLKTKFAAVTGSIAFEYRKGPEGKRYGTLTIMVNNIIGPAVSLNALHEATGVIVQNKNMIGEVMINAWQNGYFEDKAPKSVTLQKE